MSVSIAIKVHLAYSFYSYSTIDLYKKSVGFKFLFSMSL